MAEDLMLTPGVEDTSLFTPEQTERRRWESRFGVVPAPEVAVGASTRTALSSGLSPDAAAEQQRWAARFKLPIDTVGRNSDEVRQADVARRMIELGATSPGMARVLSDPNFMSIVHDVPEELSTFHKLITSPWKATQAVASAIPALAGGVMGYAAAMKELSGKGEGARHYKAAQDAIAYAKQVADVPDDASTLHKWTAGALQSLGQSVGTVGLGYLVGGPGGAAAALGAMGVSSAGTSAVKGYEAGLSPWENMRFATTDGIIEVGTEMLPTLGLMKGLKAGSKLIPLFFKNQVQEQWTEQIATHLQDLNEWASIDRNKGKTFGDYLAERPAATLQTMYSTLISGGGQVAVLKALDKVAHDRGVMQREAMDAELTGLNMENLTKAAAAGKVKARNSTAFGDFIQSVQEESGTAPAAVWVDPNVLMRTLEQAGVTPDEIKQAMPSVAEQLDDALQTEHDIRIPLSEFMANLPGTGLDAALIPHLRTENVDGELSMTQDEAKTFLQSDQMPAFVKAAQKLLDEKKVDDAFTASRNVVEAELTAQMEKAGRFTKDVNQAYSTIMGAFYAVTAHRLGITPEAMLKKYPITIQSTTAKRANKLDQDNVIRQRLAAKLVDFDAAAAEYAALPDSAGGKVLNTDTARELSPDYMADRTKSAAVHEPASQFVKDLYAKKLAEQPKEGEAPLVLFTAGGTGAGKSSGIAAVDSLSATARQAQIIFDTNMNGYESSKQKVEQALAAGKFVHIALVMRDPVDALVNGALPRATRQEQKFGTGRTVPYREHIKTHIGARDTVARLAEEYAGDGRVAFTYVDNSKGPGGATEVAYAATAKLDYNRLEGEILAALEKSYAEGKISQATYRGFRGEETTGHGTGLGEKLQGELGQGTGEQHQQALVEDSLENPVQPGQPFLVYRVGTSGSLAGRNAGNAKGVAAFLAHADDIDSPVSAGGEYLHLYRVTVNQPFGSYDTYNKGRSGNEQVNNTPPAGTVGRSESGRYKGAIAYSFPTGGDFTYEVVATVPRSELYAFIKEKSKYSDFDGTGVDLGAKLLQEFAQTKLPKTFEQSVPLRAGKESLRKYGILPGKRHTTREIAMAFERRQADKYGKIDLKDYSPAAAARIAKWMADEVQFEMLHPEDSGVGWYSEKLQRAIDAAGDVFPELKTDQAARDIFTLMLATTSDGVEAHQNYKMALGVYSQHRAGLPLKLLMAEEKNPNIVKHLAKLQDYLSKHTQEELRVVLLAETTVQEANKVLRAKGMKAASDYLKDTKLPVSAIVLGPKIGAFAANLLGAHGYLTMDRWWTRTFNRYRGHLTFTQDDAAPEHLFTVMDAMLEENPSMEDPTDDQIREWIAPYVKSAADQKFKNLSPIETAANRVHASLGKTRDSPANGSDRAFMIAAADEAQRVLKRRGVEMSVADIQAVLWYYEKRLYPTFGARPSNTDSYEDAAEILIPKLVAEQAAGGDLRSLRANDSVDDADGDDGSGGRVDENSEADATATFDQSSLASGVDFPEHRTVAPAALDDFSKGGITGILGKSDWTILSAESPPGEDISAEEAADRTEQLRAVLTERGLDHIEVKGKYGKDEVSFVVTGLNSQQALDLGREFGQESVLTRDGLIYQDGSVNPARKVTVFDTKPDDFYTTMPDGTMFQVDIDFDQRLALPADGSRIGSVEVAGVRFSSIRGRTVDGRHKPNRIPGGEDKRVANAADKRIKDRINFYVDEGKGIKPESGVEQPQPHSVILSNLYDAGSDVLGIWAKAATTNDKESAVLDAGYSGHYSRGVFGAHGAATLLGDASHTVIVRPGLVEGFPLPPSETMSETKQLALRVTQSKSLPSGALPVSQWDAIIKAVDPELHARLEEKGAFDSDKQEPLYRDEFVKTFYQGNEARGQITFADDVTTKPTVITLLQKADLTTFLHEMGHFQLEVLSHIARQPNAPQEIVDDMATLLKWFGVKDQATWDAMTLEQKRPHHETYARGFEAYLFEGKSPNTALAGVFARFRAWMITVYKSLANLNVQLTPEVRGVFDRLVATNEEIVQAEQARGMITAIKSKPAGVSNEEWAAFTAAEQEATQDAVDKLQTRSVKDLKWAVGARAKAVKDLQAQALEKRKQVATEVAAEVLAEPIYAAMRFLRTGELPASGLSNAQRKALDAMSGMKLKLSLPVLKEMYGEGGAAQWRYLPQGTKNGVVAADGVSPETVAELFGFTSGDHLVREMLAVEPAKSVIEGRTDQRMLERYGDLSSQEAINKAADEAVHNEARLKFVATELAMLEDATNITQPTGKKISYKSSKTGKMVEYIARANVFVQMAKLHARGMVAQKKIRDLKPNVYLAAESRAGKAAFEESSSQKKMAAKRTQLINMQAYRAALDAQREIERSLRYLKKIGDSDTIARDYRDQINALLERYDLRQVSLADLDRRQSLLEWYNEQVAANPDNPPLIPEKLLAEAQRISYRDVSIEEFRGLVDTIKNIEHMGRLKSKLLAAKDAREFGAAVDKITAGIKDNAKGTVPERKHHAVTFVEKAKVGVSKFFAMHVKFANTLREMDGWKDNGVMYQMFGWGANKAAAAEAISREKVTVRLTELFKTIDGKMTEKMYIPEVKDSFRREERIMIALNTGNAGNLQRLMDGDKWTLAQVQAVVDTLTKQEMDFVQSVWDYIGSFKGEIGAQQKRLTGVEPTWVEATPVHTKHGTYRGGYLPAKYNTDLSTRAMSNEAMSNIMDMAHAARGKPKTRDSMTKARAEKVTDRPLRKDFGVVTQHLTEVTHRLAWQDYLYDSNRLLAAPAVDAAIREHYGADTLAEMRNALKDIADGEKGGQNAVERGLDYVRSGATIAGLGWRVTTSLLQPIGLTQSMVRIGPKWVGKGLMQWLGDATKMENTVANIYEKSDFMRLRGKTMQREISEIRNVVSDKNSAITGSYFYLIQKMQMVADVPTWLGQYEKSVAAGLSEADSIAQADQAVLDAQGGGQIKDLAAVQRGGPLMKLFTNFYSFFNTTYNLTRESVGRTDFKSVGSVGHLAVDMLLLYTVPAVLGTLLKAALSDKDEDEDKLLRKMIADQLNYLFGTVVLAREVGAAVNMALGLPANYSGPAGVRIFGELANLGKQLGQGEADEALFKATAGTAGILFHLPSGQVASTLDGIYALATGKTEHPGVLLVGSSKQ